MHWGGGWSAAGSTWDAESTEFTLLSRYLAEVPSMRCANCSVNGAAHTVRIYALKQCVVVLLCVCRAELAMPRSANRTKRPLGAHKQWQRPQLSGKQPVIG